MTSGRRESLLGRNRTARFLLPVLLVVFVALTWWRLRDTRPEFHTHQFSGPTMGTTYAVKLVGPVFTPDETRRVSGRIEGELDRVNALMSTYLEDSELSRLNRAPAGKPFGISPETAHVLDVAQQVSAVSEGAFDVTVGPLVALWGFGATDRAPRPPAEPELAGVRSAVGYRNLELDAASGSVTKAVAGVRVDLSAIAKGYAVDRVAAGLEELGYERFLVEIGGEVTTRGIRADGGPWRVAIEKPDPERRAVHRVIELGGLAMATSGDYRNYYSSEGVWLSHLIDPRTERPIAHDLASVSVVHESCTWADALATALIVLGPEEGYALAESEGLAAHFLIREGEDAFRARSTSRFRELFGDAGS